MLMNLTHWASQGKEAALFCCLDLFVFYRFSNYLFFSDSQMLCKHNCFIYFIVKLADISLNKAFSSLHVCVCLWTPPVKCKLMEGLVEVSGGGLGHVYSSLQLHFHWGSEGSHDSPGSEHTVDSKRYAMEVVWHWNPSFSMQGFILLICMRHHLPSLCPCLDAHSEQAEGFESDRGAEDTRWPGSTGILHRGNTSPFDQVIQF